jgi:hypothetical protein
MSARFATSRTAADVSQLAVSSPSEKTSCSARLVSDSPRIIAAYAPSTSAV